MVTAVDNDGQPNTNAFPVTPYLAEATKGLWVTSRDVGYPDGLYEANGNWAPRLGVVYRPFSKDFVIRSGYGIYYNSYTGNRGASTVNVPHWSLESQTFGLSTFQNWQTAWPSTPTTFGPGTIYAPAVNLRPARTHEWNVSLQTSLPWRTALTVAYVGTQVSNEIAGRLYNEASVGPHSNLQADRPFPRFASIYMVENFAKTWYNALQTKVERRFSAGLAFTFAYSFSRNMSDNTPDCELCVLLPESPASYNRGRTGFDRRHIEFATVVWEVPFGKGKKFGSGIHRAADLVLGGWQLAVTQQAQSGPPLSISAGVANLGNGWTPRANVTGDPTVAEPTPERWFNTGAFSTPPLYVFGNSGIGLLESPGNFAINTNLSKNFNVTESKYFQLRWESFNSTNRVNYNAPSNAVTSATFGRITSAGTARYMQLGLKFLF
jgi:hypothetical protein